MIKFENVEVVGWEAAIRGMRNPMNSWDKSDSGYCIDTLTCHACKENRNNCKKNIDSHKLIIGPNDIDLMKRLSNAGTDHRKFMRMLTVYADITAPLYWWKEFDTYKVGTVANSCSTMHKIHAKEFTTLDFSEDKLLLGIPKDSNHIYDDAGNDITMSSQQLLGHVINHLNVYRKLYLETKDNRYWWQMIQLLPSSYNQKRTVMLNYEVLANIYKSRKNHKLDEWCCHEGIIDGDKTNKSYIGFCDWIETLPYSELITSNK